MSAKWLTGIALAALVAGAPARGDTLREALLSTYQDKPELLAARSRLRATDEAVGIAKADGRLNVSGNATYLENVKPPTGSFASPARQVAGSIDAQLPIFAGGTVRNSVRAARSRVEAGRASLRGTESQIFTDAVAAYLDVIRDQSIVELNAGQVGVLETNLQASQDRFEVGDLTRTDVAQSEARLSLARSQFEAAQAQLVASRENYARIIGRMPTDLETPPTLPGLPETVDQALALALEDNPELIAARKESEASRYDVGVARGTRLPRLSAIAGGDYINYLDSLGSDSVTTVNRSTSASVGARLTVPFYQGGGPGARVRQSQARASEAAETMIAVERGVIAQLRSAYAGYSAAQAVIRSASATVAANELALEGVRAENGVGTRDVLDVLNAEQELLNARVQLVSARRDAYVAGFALLAAMGRAEAGDLGLDGGALYDPVANYKRVRTSLFDWGDDGTPSAKAPRTVDLAPLPSEALKPLSAPGATPQK